MRIPEQTEAAGPSADANLAHVSLLPQQNGADHRFLGSTKLQRKARMKSYLARHRPDASKTAFRRRLWFRETT